MASMKLQTTLTGHTGWAIAKLAAVRGKSQAEIASHLLEKFFEDNPNYLSQHEITYKDFDLHEKGGRVVQMEGRVTDGTREEN